MNIFGVFVMICGIAVSIARPQDPEWRYVRKQPIYTQQNDQRLRNFPGQQMYQQEIEYPGTVYMNPGFQNAYVSRGQQPAYVQTMPAQYIPRQQHPVHIRPQTQNVQLPAEPQYATTTPVTIIEEEQSPLKFQPPTVSQEIEPSSISAIPQQIPVEYSETPASIPIPAVRAPVRRVKINRDQAPQPLQTYVPEPVQPIQPVQKHRFSFTSPTAAAAADDVEEKPARRVPHEETEEERLLRDEQARNAHYAFGTSIDDKINDHSIQREEVRDGLALRGMYSYSDGFFKRTVHYEADENGYRVVKELVEPIGDGPQYDPNGTADVSANLHDSELNYSITARDFVRERKTKVPVNARTPVGAEEDQE